MNGEIQTSASSPHAILRDLSATSPESGGTTRRRSNTYALVIAGVLCISGASILAMRQMGLKAGLDLSKATLTYKPKATVSTASFERVLVALEASDHPVQVPTENIKIDPFALESQTVTSGPSERTLAEAEKLRLKALEEEQRRIAQRAEDIQTRLTQMKLISVMGGRYPIANIDGTLVQAGDVIAEMFTVIEIQGSKVVLEADGVRYELVPGGSLDSPPPAPNRRRDGR